MCALASGHPPVSFGRALVGGSLAARPSAPLPLEHTVSVCRAPFDPEQVRVEFDAPLGDAGQYSTSVGTQ